MSPACIEPGSFRDREGRIVYLGERVYRVLSEKALSDWRVLERAQFFARHVQAGTLIGTQEVDAPPTADAAFQSWAGVLHHDALHFVTYPYEWSFHMLKDAARLQLTLILDAMNESMTMKDASSFNIQWRGVTPVFIDIASFEPLDERSPWMGYRQFCELFLFPLMIQAYKNIDFQSFLRGRLDGISPELAAKLMSFRDYLRPGVIPHVLLQSKLQMRLADSKRDVKHDLKQAGFNRSLIENNIMRLRRLVEKLVWVPPKSQWSDYVHLDHYSSDATRAKQEFVGQAAALRRRKLVWDLGCNTGIYSRIAAKYATCVIAMDADHLAVDRLYTGLKTDAVDNIIPLVINLADGSPNLGWRNSERKTLEERGRPDLVLCLALIHHVVIGANIPLGEFIAWLAHLRGDLIIEFVDKQDDMVKRLLRNKRDVYTDYEREYFEACLKREHRILHTKALPGGTRHLYYAESQSGPQGGNHG